MSRLHEALRRAAGGDAPILPPEAGIDGGKEASPNQQAFSVPWALDAQAGDGAAGPGGEPGQDAASGGQASALFRTRPVQGDRHIVNEKLVVTTTGESGASDLAVAVEQYRKLAATLHHAQGERGLKIVMVTSSNPGEGKSLTASNLSLTLSGSYERRVLLIDGDLRRPSLHDVFGVSNTTGLSDGLQGNPGQGLAVFELTQRMSLLPSGGPLADPTGVLTSAAMRRVLEAARARYDWTVVDTPPVGLLSDARHLSDMVDGILLVVEAGVSQYQDVLRAIDIIGRERLLGVVLNRLPFTQNTTHYYSQYYGRPKEAGS